MSRQVVFDENLFPFAALSPASSTGPCPRASPSLTVVAPCSTFHSSGLLSLTPGPSSPSSALDVPIGNTSGRITRLLFHFIPRYYFVPIAH